MKPYIGVTGFTKRGEVEDALSVFHCARGRKLMVGVLASWKSIRGIPMNPKWQAQTPNLEAIKDIFCADERVLNLVHYSAHSRREQETLFSDMFKIYECAEKNFHGFQLNIPWPNLHQLDDYRSLDYGSTHTIILQIGKDSVLDVGGTPEGMVSALENYVGVVDGVLFDPSGGRGEPFDPERAILYLSAIEDAGWNLGLGVAGGLGPHTNHLIKPVAKRFQDISIDAQGKLRDSGNNLDTEAMKRYLVNMLNILS